MVDRPVMLLLIDENLPRRLGQLFTERGHHVEYVTVGAKDPEIIATADAMGAILVTSDVGFLRRLSRIPARDKGRFKRAGLIVLGGDLTTAMARLHHRIALLEHLFVLVQQEPDKRLIVELREHAVHAHL
ncbi:MAG: DUF5615 family PIN-like protein [Chloroflexota bacterium]|nr:DUF5615 family PIN-like protein [Chloroflexota bacterium]